MTSGTDDISSQSEFTPRTYISFPVIGCSSSRSGRDVGMEDLDDIPSILSPSLVKTGAFGEGALGRLVVRFEVEVEVFFGLRFVMTDFAIPHLRM